MMGAFQCQGDSGSPMILPSKKGDWQQDLQVGVGEPFTHYLYLYLVPKHLIFAHLPHRYIVEQLI
jgi:hypothetical protein